MILKQKLCRDTKTKDWSLYQDFVFGQFLSHYTKWNRLDNQIKEIASLENLKRSIKEMD